MCLYLHRSIIRFRTMSPLPTSRMRSPRSPNLQAMVRARSPARTPPGIKPRSHSAIRSYSGANLPNTNGSSLMTKPPAAVDESKILVEPPKASSKNGSLAQHSTETSNDKEKQNEDKIIKTEIEDKPEFTVVETEPRSISPVLERSNSYRSPLPTFKLGGTGHTGTGHITSSSVSSAPGSITPLISRRAINSTTADETNPGPLIRTSSNASNLSNLSQSAQEMLMSISSDLTGLATQSSYALDEFFGIDQGTSTIMTCYCQCL